MDDIAGLSALPPHAYGVDDAFYISFLSPVPFSRWVTLAKPYWVTLAEHRSGCSADVELVRQIREVWAENPGIAAEELAYKIKDRAKLKRLTARVRRVMQEAVA